MASVRDCIDRLHVSCPAGQENHALLYLRQIRHEMVSHGRLELDSERSA